MTISVGDRLPDAVFRVMTPDGPDTMTTSAVFGGKKVVLFAIPGAFTPTCHAKHVPNFLDNLDALKAKGVDTVACVAVNDVFVMDAWAKATGGDEKILFLSDGSADFTKAIDLVFDATEIGLGLRSQRYAMLVDDGVVKVLNVETERGTIENSSAEKILAAL
jgi:peroxiredoxin